MLFAILCCVVVLCLAWSVCFVEVATDKPLHECMTSCLNAFTPQGFIVLVQRLVQASVSRELLFVSACALRKSATADCTEQLQRPDRIAVSPQKKLPQICI
jgi:hypothetical protein